MSNKPSQVIKLFGKTIIQQVDNTQSNSTQTTSSSSSTSTSLEADQETSTGMEKAGGGGGGGGSSSKTAVVSCPRCKSKETKFCYFNNYNVNQPRHFCKSCRRYWTAGGTLRTVPVGAGRRKNRAPHPDGELGSTCLGLDQDIH